MPERVRKLIAAGFGAGYAPGAPGTFGTMAAVLPAWGLSFLEPPLSGVLTVLFIAFAVWICGGAAAGVKEKDPGWIVLDEMAGFLVATLWVEPTPVSYAAAFFLFRLFDIIKPPPIGWIDRSGRGGTAIVMDDVAAGVLTRLMLIWPLGF